jgi:Protein of unknown function (DUF2934)
MSLIHDMKPFFELGLCKEYFMARKTTGTTATRSKKTPASIQPPVAQVAPEAGMDVPRNGKSAKVLDKFVSSSPVPSNLNLEEQIRRRAYELYLERRAISGGENGYGDENQDWLMAEREVRSRLGGEEQHSA